MELFVLIQHKQSDYSTLTLSQQATTGTKGVLAFSSASDLTQHSPVSGSLSYFLPVFSFFPSTLSVHS